MPKSTDITGTFRVPEEMWGRFWNAMLTIDGADITPETRVQDPAKREAHYMSAKCIILGVLAQNRKKKLAASWLADLLAEAGKDRLTTPKLLQSLRQQKLVAEYRQAYSITPAGLVFYQTQCNGV